MDKRVNPTDLSLHQWTEFKSSIVWQAILFEIEERDTYILDILRRGNDSQWSDENMRGRLNELEYFTAIPDIIIKDLELAEQSNNEKEKLDGRD